MLIHDFFKSVYLPLVKIHGLFYFDLNLLFVNFVDLLNLFYLRFRLFLGWEIRSNPNVWYVLEPYGAVIVLDELTFHSEDFILVKFRNVVAHLVRLLQAVRLFIVSDEIHVFSECSEIILDSFIDIFLIDMGIEFHSDGVATSNLSLDVGLDTVHSLPEVVVSLLLENICQSITGNYLNTWRQLSDVSSHLLTRFGSEAEYAFFFNEWSCLAKSFIGLHFLWVYITLNSFGLCFKWIKSDNCYVFVKWASCVFKALVLLGITLNLRLNRRWVSLWVENCIRVF